MFEQTAFYGFPSPMVSKTNSLTLPDEQILQKIYLIRGRKVMLDRDLAALYGVSTGNLNKAVRRQIKRFPEDFMFQLSADEFKNLIFQFGTSRWGGTRKPPFAFTEAGVGMLSGVLNSDKAIHVHIQLVRIFIRIRQALSENTELHLEIEKIRSKVDNQDKNMEIVFQYLDQLIDQHKKTKRHKPVGFKIGTSPKS